MVMMEAYSRPTYDIVFQWIWFQLKIFPISDLGPSLRRRSVKYLNKLSYSTLSYLTIFTGQRDGTGFPGNDKNLSRDRLRERTGNCCHYISATCRFIAFSITSREAKEKEYGTILKTHRKVLKVLF